MRVCDFMGYTSKRRPVHREHPALELKLLISIGTLCRTLSANRMSSRSNKKNTAMTAIDLHTDPATRDHAELVVLF
jgi:hypothetical protein